MPGHGHALGYGASSISLITAAGLGVGRVTLSNSSISELAPSGSTIGTLSVINGQGSYTFTVQDDPDNKFTIVVDQLRTDAALNFETATSHTVNVRADNGQDDPIDTVITIAVTNAFEGPPFNALTLSVSQLVRGVEYTIDILGATPGSTIEGTVPDGMVLDGVARRVTGTPTTSGESISLVESGLDSQPRTSEPPVVVEDPDPLNTLTLSSPVSRNSTVALQGVTAGSTFEAVTTPPGWVLDDVTGEFDIGDTATLGTQNWSVREIPSNPVLQPRISSGTVTVESGQPPLDFIAYGQSNILRWATDGDGSVTAHPDTYIWDSVAGEWATPTGNGVIEFLNAMQAATGRVCRIVVGGQGGVPIAWLQKDSPDSNAYTNLMDDIVASDITPAFILWHHGEGDASGTGSTIPVYPASLDTLHGDLATDTGRTRATLPIVLSSLATTSFTMASDENWEAMQNTLANINASYPDIHFSHSNFAAERVDQFHWTAASYGKSGRLSARTVQVLRGDVSGRPDFTIGSDPERVSATQTRVTVIHGLGTDFSPATGITGFEIKTSQTAWLTATAERESPTTILLTHADLGTVARQIEYQRGRDPDTTGAVVDNSPLEVPLVYTIGAILAPGATAAPVLTYQNRGFVNGGASQSFTMSMAFPNAVTEDSLCIIAGGHGQDPADVLSLQITAQPSGTVITADEVVQSQANVAPKAFLYQAVVPAGTTSITGDIVYDGAPFSWAFYNAWTSPTSGLDSLTAVTNTARETSAQAIATSLATAEGGFSIFWAHTLNDRGLGSVTGDETYTVREQAEFAGASWLSGDAQNVSLNAANDMQVDFDPPNDAMVIAAGHWR